MRRLLWIDIPPGTLLDDVFVPMSLVMRGWRIGFSFDAHAFDQRTFDADGEAVRKTRTLTANLQLFSLLPGILSPRRNPVALQFVGHKLLRLLTPVLSALAISSGGVAVVAMRDRIGVAGWLAIALVGLLLIAIPPTRRRIGNTAPLGASDAVGCAAGALQRSDRALVGVGDAAIRHRHHNHRCPGLLRKRTRLNHL